MLSERSRSSSRSLKRIKPSPMVEPPVPRPGMFIFRSTFALLKSTTSLSVVVGDIDKAWT